MIFQVKIKMHWNGIGYNHFGSDSCVAPYFLYLIHSPNGTTGHSHKIPVAKNYKAR